MERRQCNNTNLKYQSTIVLSACMQMLLLGTFAEAERRTGLPVIIASVYIMFQMLGPKAIAQMPEGRCPAATAALRRSGFAGWPTDLLIS